MYNFVKSSLGWFHLVILSLGIVIIILYSFKPIESNQVFCFEDVSVIPMTANTILKNQTVIATNGKITFIGEASKATIPANAIKINAKGKFLIPGFIDCYAHIHEKNPPLFIANGITTVRNAPGQPFQHGVKYLSDNGKIFAPRIYSAGVPVSGQIASYHTQGIIANVEEARFAVRETKRMGYDALFVYVTISQETYTAVLDEAEKLNINVEGHLPYLVKFKDYATGAQRSFDNLVGFMNLQTGETYPKERLVEMAKDFKASNKYIIPTLTIHKARALSGKDDSLRQTANMKYVPPRQRAYWHLSSPNYKYIGAPLLVKTFYEQGLKLLLGSDAGFHFVIPGFSYHDEMQNFSELGIPNYDILKAGTIDAAAYLGWQEKIGTIEVNKEADMVLLDANPLEYISNTRRIAGVMLKGKWYPKTELDKKLSVVEAELKQMSGNTDRLKSFKNPSVSYKPIALYNIYYKDVLCGNEIIYSNSNGERTKIISHNSIDPPAQRNTTTEWIIKNGVPESVWVKRSSVEGVSAMKLRKSGNYFSVKGSLPFLGKVNFADSSHTQTLLAGPNTSINIDMDIVGNFYVLLKKFTPLELDQSDSVMVKKVELNPEEWGKNAVIGNMKYKIKRLSDENHMKIYEVIQPGFNGVDDFSFKAIIKSNTAGLIEEVEFNDDVIAKRMRK